MAKEQFQNIKELYSSLKIPRDVEMPLWTKISNFVGIQVEPNNQKSNLTTEREDYLVDDPTAALSVNQAGDYLQGVVWGTGDNALTLEPSDYVLQKTEAAVVKDYYQFGTKRLLAQMNHSRAGLSASMKSYFYDQMSFGTSGIGAFKNNNFVNGIEDNALIFRGYGVDNLVIDEGKNGLIDVIFVPYKWRVNRIVHEFASVEDGIDGEVFNSLPKPIKDAYNKNDFNQEFNIVQSIYPRENYDPKLKGKRGARYVGQWFLEDDDSKPFFEEDYRKMPIAVARAIKVRGKVWGRSSGSLLISSISSVNYMFSKSVEVIEKMASTPLGTWNSALFGDSVLDTSADGITVFNEAMQGSNQSPVFPLADVGDPSGLINFLIPYLNDKITTGFKVDVLLDFSDSTERTATEMMQRFVIRGKSLAGLSQQQKVELLEPLVDRCISLLEDVSLMGIDPSEEEELAKQVKVNGRPEEIIPQAVLECIKEGKPWYKIKFNNELEKLTRTEGLERIMQSINSLMMIGQLYPMILEAVNFYDMWRDVNAYLGVDYAVSEDDFKSKIQAVMEQQKAQLMAQAGQVGAGIEKDVAMANKANAEAKK